MNQLLASAWVIARRDYGATVFSRIFILFLITPLFSLMFGGIFAMLGHDDQGPSRPPLVVLTGDKAVTDALLAARARLVARLGDDALPALRAQPGGGDPKALLARTPQDGRFMAVLGGTLAHPVLAIRGGDDGTVDRVGLIVDVARAGDAPATKLAVERIAVPETHSDQDRRDVARGAQTGVFFLLVLLAGMSLSTFVEEKSNKVIEVLAAAVPVDAIFVGKLAAMLAISLTGVAIWGGTAAAAVLIFFPHALAHAATPAIGWPLFFIAAIGYFVVSYLLIGAVFLGIGSQASSPREVQSMAMPVTMLQLLIFGFASAGTAHPHGWLAIGAALFPWSSPLAMLGRAAMGPSLWPHLLALMWQLLWLVLALRVAAAMFRSAVLKSGGRRRFWKRRPA